MGVSACVFNGSHDDIARQQLGKYHGRASDPSWVHDIQWDAASTVRLNEAPNVCIVVGPVCNHVGNICIDEGPLHFWCEEYRGLVRKTGDTPVGCDINENRIATCNVVI